MRTKNLSLIVKIAFMIFVAFVIILGNEIRLGVDRYVNNTLQSDASTNARLLEKLEKSYIEEYTTKVNRMSSDSFLATYDSFLDDSSKMKCLVDKEGNIIDISRAEYKNPAIHILREFDNDTKEPIYFNIETLHEEALHSLENYLLNHTDQDVKIKIVFTGSTSDQEEISTFYKIQIKELYVDNTKIYLNTKLKGKTKTYEGPLGYFEDLDYLMLYEIENVISNSLYDGLNGEIVKEKVVIYDYSSMHKNLEEEIENNFNAFIDQGNNFMNTSYSSYYLLDLIEDPENSNLSYSTTMCKFVDWYSIKESNQTATDLVELENQGIEGYCFITQQYNHLYLEATRQFIIDNITTYSLTVLLMGLICIGLAYFIIKPIRKIEQTAQAITQKDFHHRLKSNRHDEIGSLARSINSMSSELEKTINNLHLEIDHVKQLEDLRKEFVSNFTHEIKTPLGIINGFSELIEIEQDEDKRNEYIDIIQQETRKINQLVLAMLDLSKLESKNISLDMSEVDLVKLCEDTLETMMYHIQQKKIMIEKDFHSCILQADYQKMEMVITNLIANAIRYTHENGHIYITINDVGFYVENEGSHIPEDELKKVWLAFHKTNKSRNDQGTGLGLSICRAALELHGMKYGAKNTRKGVLFYFEFK